MTDPATGTVAATTATAVSAGGMFTIGTIMPAGASPYEFAWACFFAMLGAACFQFIEAQVRRQSAADNGVPMADRPKIDTVMLGYAMFGAPLAAACLLYVIHTAKGATGFGDPSFLQSAAGFMVAGAVGPKLVLKVVAMVTAMWGAQSQAPKDGGKS